MRLLRSLLLLSTITAGTLVAQAPPMPKQVPPKGVAIPDPDRATLTSGAADLAKKIEALKRPGAAGMIADEIFGVEVLHKAVDWALRYDEFFDVKQVAAAKSLLAEGMKRAEPLANGQVPWSAQTGPVVRAYRSRIDGSVQPYGLIIPADWKPGDQRPRPLYVFNHGRGENLTELVFISAQIKGAKDFTPADAFVLHPYGRFCNATKFAGETDVLEAIANVQAHYPIDAKRLVMTGFSMGGASAWHLGAHHASRWVAVSPGAGFAETARYLKVFAEGKTPPPWWEQTLWRLYDAPPVAANLANTRVVAYAGEDDPQKASSEMMEEAAKSEGVTIERLLAPKTGHKYAGETKTELDRRLAEAAAKGRAEVPAKVRLVTHTLKYHRQAWVVADALEKHWERAEVNAEIVDEGTIRATTRNVAALTFDMQASAVPLDKTRPPRVVIDEQELVGPPVKAPWAASFQKTSGKWTLAKSGGPKVGKTHNLQGPIDDAFMDSFVFVKPTGKPLNATVGAWVQGEIERAVPQWRTVFRGDARVVDDTAVTADMVANSNLVLWGDPSSNKLIARILPSLPIRWDAYSLALGKLSVPAAHHAAVLIYPNPLNPKRYVVLNSSFTFRQGSNASNATQTPKLPDWAVVDLRTPPSEKAPGLIVDAGFFDEAWQVPK